MEFWHYEFTELMSFFKTLNILKELRRLTQSNDFKMNYISHWKRKLTTQCTAKVQEAQTGSSPAFSMAVTIFSNRGMEVRKHRKVVLSIRNQIPDQHSYLLEKSVILRITPRGGIQSCRLEFKSN